jgi:hypothetical protein
VGLTKFGKRINSILPALPLSDLLPPLEGTLDSTICNSSVHKEFKILITLYHNFISNTFQNGYPENRSWGMEEWSYHSVIGVWLLSHDISFRQCHKMTHRAPNERIFLYIFIYINSLSLSLSLSLHTHTLRLSTSLIDLDRSRLMLHWKDGTYPL